MKNPGSNIEFKCSDQARWQDYQLGKAGSCPGAPKLQWLQKLQAYCVNWFVLISLNICLEVCTTTAQLTDMIRWVRSQLYKALCEKATQKDKLEKKTVHTAQREEGARLIWPWQLIFLQDHLAG